MLRRIIKVLALIIGVLVIVVMALVVYVRAVAVADPPEAAVKQLASTTMPALTLDSGLYRVGNNWFRQSESGLYEMYVEGNALQRGLAAGQLSQDLVRLQERVFNDQIEKLIPSPAYRETLKYFVGWFNRDIGDFVDEEFKTEIFGISQVSSHDYDHIAPAYQRILNYHGAHDIGHALQNMSLVGCTAFGTWGNQSADSTLIIGRNFDFYVGDEFAQNKIIAFYKPDKGYPFMMVTFGGMTGVLSGMNQAGLTVTLNAAKSDIPSAAATPVSLVAREILQYASTIDEAYAIAKKRRMFVAESFLIGSAKDGKAALIEKDTHAIDLVVMQDDRIISTNHFQGKILGDTPLNHEHIENSASMYRYERVRELLDRQGKNTIEKTVALLRDQKGKGDRDIGLGNEKSVNQLIAHHGIVFQPERGLVWVSAAPYQLGRFVCYDLNKVLSEKMNRNKEVYEPEKNLAADAFVNADAFKTFMAVQRYRFPFNQRDDLQPSAIVRANPEAYHAYLFSGDVYLNREQYDSATLMYEKALTKEIATSGEREHIERNLEKAKTNLQ